jgi:signal transduction histidine kinase/ActR/RegA family two-component response regulator
VCWDVLPETRGSPLAVLLEQVMHERRSVLAEVPSAAQPGRWLHARIYPTVDGLSIYFRDVTEEREAQEMHLRNEARLREALKAARMAAWEHTWAGDGLSYSDDALETLGIAITALPTSGSDAVAFIHPADRQQHLTTIRAARLAPDFTYVSVFRVTPEVQLDPSAEIWLEDRGRLTTDADGTFIGARGVLQDITVSRQVEARVSQLNAQLEQRVEELQTILDVAPVGTAFAEDASCQRVTSSAGLQRMLQVAPGENVSASRPDADRLPFRVLRDGTPVPPDMLPMQTAVRTGQPVWEYECDLELTDGTLKHLLINAAPLFDEAGHVRGAIGIHVDISARVSADMDRQRLLATAEAARAEAEQSNKAKDDFLAVLSHELRSPLQSVFGWVQVLRTAPVDTEQFTRALATIERNIRQQSQLINDMLDVSRIVTGKLTFHMHPVRVSEVLDETLDELRPQAQARDIAVQLALDESPVVVADRGRLRQVLANVFINAVKFTPPGGTIRIASRTDHDDAVVTIQDTGDGIPPDLLPQVFDRFRQADTGSTRHHEGLGLGLAIAHHIIEQHGGTITAHSDGPGQGSTFLIRLPRATTCSTLAEPVAPETTERQLLAGVRVLVVDDHQDTVELLQYVLSLAGAAVRTAMSVSDALASMREQQPDVLVSDLSMPGEDGYALLAAVRREYGDGLPAVALSGLARAEDRRRALAAGFDAHLSKPVEPAALVLALTKAVFRKAADAPTSPEALPPANARQAGA